MAPGVNSLLVLAAGDPLQAAVIPQVMLQGSVDTLLEAGSRGIASRLKAGSGADQLIAGHLAGVIELDQIGETPLETAGQSIGQRQELSDNRIAA